MGLHDASDTISDTFMRKAVETAMKKVQAKWWIENRTMTDPITAFLKERDLDKMAKPRDTVGATGIIHKQFTAYDNNHYPF
jgi:hypothetical protein